MRFKLCFTLLLFSSSVQSEYRAYQYLVTDKSSEGRAFSSLAISTHNPKSFKSYYANSKTTQIDLVRSWRCPGDTSNYKAICKTVEDLLTEKNLTQKASP